MAEEELNRLMLQQKIAARSAEVGNMDGKPIEINTFMCSSVIMSAIGRQTTLRLPREMHKALRHRAADEERSMTAVLTDAIGEYLRRGDRAGGIKDARNARERGALFDDESNIDDLAAAQGVRSEADFDSLLGDFWPAGESADEFIAQLRAWRGCSIGS
ncbi:MAG: ribbon-helix-helix protein, CopG family [Candidatus Binataceae bacterium]